MWTRQMRQVSSALTQSKANLEIARLNYDRQKSLRTQNVNSAQDLDQARTSFEAAQAAVEAAQANLQNLQIQQSFQKITAPFAGIVTRRNTDIGALINSGAASSTELFRVASNNPLRAYIAVPQSASPFVKVGATAWAELQEFPGQRFEGKVARTAGALEASSRTMLTEVQLPNPDGRLLPGSFARVHLTLEGAPAQLSLPSNALLFRSDGPQVGTVDDAGIGNAQIGEAWARLRQDAGGDRRPDGGRSRDSQSVGLAGRRHAGGGEAAGGGKRGRREIARAARTGRRGARPLGAGDDRTARRCAHGRRLGGSFSHWTSRQSAGRAPGRKVNRRRLRKPLSSAPCFALNACPRGTCLAGGRNSQTSLYGFTFEAIFAEKITMGELPPTRNANEAIFASDDGRVYTLSDVVAAAHFRGDLQAPVAAFAGEGWRPTRRRPTAILRPTTTRCRSCPTTFRSDRDLITAEETEAWLERRGLTLEDFNDYFVREYWGDALGAKVEAEMIDYNNATDEQRELLAVELLLSGDFDQMATELSLAGGGAARGGGRIRSTARRWRRNVRSFFGSARNGRGEAGGLAAGRGSRFRMAR